MSTTDALRESHIRSILKAVTWRLLATTTTGLIAYFILRGSDSSTAAQSALWIALTEAVLKLFIYYAHERVWQLVPRGGIRGLFRKVLGRKSDS